MSTALRGFTCVLDGAAPPLKPLTLEHSGTKFMTETAKKYHGRVPSKLHKQLCSDNGVRLRGKAIRALGLELLDFHVLSYDPKEDQYLLRFAPDPCGIGDLKHMPKAATA